MSARKTRLIDCNPWVDGSTPAPSGFDLAQLQADLAAIGAAA